MTRKDSSSWRGSNIGYTSSSVCDGSSDVMRRARTEPWIPTLIQGDVGSVRTDMSSCPIVNSWTTVAGSIAEEVEEWSDDTDLESDDEMDFDVVQRLFVRGNEHFKEARFAETAKFFDAGVNRTHALSYSRQSSLGLDEIRSKLGSSYAELDLRRAYDFRRGTSTSPNGCFGNSWGSSSVKRMKLGDASSTHHLEWRIST